MHKLLLKSRANGCKKLCNRQVASMNQQYGDLPLFTEGTSVVLELSFWRFQVSELETKAAKNAVEAAQLESELLANEREAMRQELGRVCSHSLPPFTTQCPRCCLGRV